MFHRKVQVPGCVEVVDAGIADLLQALWAKGLRTEQSCEDWGTLIRSGSNWGPLMEEIPPGWAYIKFVTSWECARFCRSLDEYLTWGLPPGEGEHMFVSFPGSDIPALTAQWRK